MTSPEIEVIEELSEQIKVQIPKMYKVLLHNDDATTMDFVVQVLTRIFHKTAIEADEITLMIHQAGEGIAGSPYTKEIAEEKTRETIECARANNFPLVASYEEL
jgi:ATP-dependent Clp protease adaptor protein ClpS